MLENHLEHIMVHQQLPNSPSFLVMQTEHPEMARIVFEYNTQHMRDHQAMMQQLLQVQMMMKGGQKPQHQTTGLNQSGTPDTLQNPPGQNPAQQQGMAF